MESSKASDFDHEVDLSGSNGRISLPIAWRIETPVDVELSRSTGWGLVETTRFPIPVLNPFRLQLEAFAAAVRRTAPPEPALAESIVNAFTLDALLASAEARTTMAIDIPGPVRAGHGART